ncbi:purine/pyrimidine permease [Clostridia bacterium]|nr:purine/pyrimidine permease [Clostridia bacterium]
MKYKLKDRPPFLEAVFYGLQWAVMIVSMNLFFPILLAKNFSFNAMATESLIQRTLLLLGVATMLQILYGHRITVFECVAAFWFSIYLLIGQSVLARGGSMEAVLGQLTFVTMLAGLIILVLAWSKSIDVMQKIFTPSILGITLVLITVQIGKSVVIGMLGIENGTINAALSLFSFSLFLVTLIISIRGGRFKSYVALIGLVFGSAMYKILGFEIIRLHAHSIISIPEVGAFGLPIANLELIPYAVFVVMIYYSNSIASVNGAASVLGVEMGKKEMRNYGVIGGVIHLLAALLACIPMVPAAMSGGFIEATGIGSRYALFLGGVFLAIMGLVAPIGSFFASVPNAVAYAVGLSVFVRMAAMGFKTCFSSGMTEKNLMVAGVSLTIGCGFMFIPAGAFANVPVLGSTLENGIFMGVLVALAMEHWIMPKAAEEDPRDCATKP